jgi:hypothetical protein
MRGDVSDDPADPSINRVLSAAMRAPIPVGEGAGLVHSGGDPWKVIATLRAYFDESGIDGGSKVTSLGGFVADSETWVGLRAGSR